MNLELYLRPVDISAIKLSPWVQKKFSLAALLEKNQEKLSLNKAKIALIGVGEDRNAVVKGSAAAPDEVRRQLYGLNRIAPRFKILDLGNIRQGKTANDTYFALKDVCEYLMQLGITVVVIGGSQDLTFGLTKAFDDRKFNLVNVDPKLDFRKGSKIIDSENYLNFVFEKHSNLFSQTTLAYQNYFTDALELDYVDGLRADAKRLGQLRYNMGEIEPYMRHADILSFDLNAVRVTDAPGQYFASPNGLYAEEACQVAHYAGMADQLKIAGFFNFIPELDPSGTSSKLMAQMIWHFLEGYYFKVVEHPDNKSDDFDEFIIEMDDVDLPLIFYQSRKTGRWWMKIIDENKGAECIIPCTQDDYELAARYEIPDRWWRNIRKMN
ncbi:formimidoylglutamase [Gaoshiqia sp. Z1-71]|uniref:formimidoylglutamase n=1 Tax=Gaoshiqia hydrogeniformans TaxID=3290090 RepID=UPI003BF84081